MLRYGHPLSRSLTKTPKGLHVQVDQGGKREELHAASGRPAPMAPQAASPRPAGWPPVETVPAGFRLS